MRSLGRLSRNKQLPHNFQNATEYQSLLSDILAGLDKTSTKDLYDIFFWMRVSYTSGLNDALPDSFISSVKSRLINLCRAEEIDNSIVYLFFEASLLGLKFNELEEVIQKRVDSYFILSDYLNLLANVSMIRQTYPKLMYSIYTKVMEHPMLWISFKDTCKILRGISMVHDLFPPEQSQKLINRLLGKVRENFSVMSAKDVLDVLRPFISPALQDTEMLRKVIQKVTDNFKVDASQLNWSFCYNYILLLRKIIESRDIEIDWVHLEDAVTKVATGIVENQKSPNQFTAVIGFLNKYEGIATREQLDPIYEIMKSQVSPSEWEHLKTAKYDYDPVEKDSDDEIDEFSMPDNDLLDEAHDDTRGFAISG